MTTCREENSSVNSGTDGGNSDIGVLADFSADEEESQMEQIVGYPVVNVRGLSNIWSGALKT